jgi:hypothetical protein
VFTSSWLTAQLKSWQKHFAPPEVAAPVVDGESPILPEMADLPEGP